MDFNFKLQVNKTKSDKVQTSVIIIKCTVVVKCVTLWFVHGETSPDRERVGSEETLASSGEAQ